MSKKKINIAILILIVFLHLAKLANCSDTSNIKIRYDIVGTNTLSFGINNIGFDFAQYDIITKGYISTTFYLSFEFLEKFYLQSQFGPFFEAPIKRDDVFKQMDQIAYYSLQVEYNWLHSEKILLYSDMAFKMVEGYLLENKLNRNTQIDFTSTFIYNMIKDIDYRFYFRVGVGHYFANTRVLPIVEIGFMVGPAIKFSIDISSYFLKYNKKEYAGALLMRD